MYYKCIVYMCICARANLCRETLFHYYRCCLSCDKFAVRTHIYTYLCFTHLQHDYYRWVLFDVAYQRALFATPSCRIAVYCCRLTCTDKLL